MLETGFDPIKLGLVTNLYKPSENITGVTQLDALVSPKRLELLHELVPKAKVLGLLVDQPALMELETNTAMSAAHSFSITLHVLHASSEGDFEGVFAKLTELGAGELVVGADPLFTSTSASSAKSPRATRCPPSLRTVRSPQPAGWRAMAAIPSIPTG